ncbi:MAG: hypothetical protein ABR999_08965 [Methanoregula sp.]|jgi:flagellar protein FlaF|uniref:hypothetical protein n=1 Tax=Methanoregula sp. TaxID=2052170 RepID=UPI003D0A7A89
MPVGELIGAAVGLILIIIVAYVLVGSTISVAETMASAQQDMTHLQEIRLDTKIEVTDVKVTGDTVSFNVKNKGGQTITDFTHMDVLLWNGDAPPLLCSLESGSPYSVSWGAGGITSDGGYTTPHSLNPGDTLTGSISLPSTSGFCVPPENWKIKVVTVNGVTSLAPITC